MSGCVAPVLVFVAFAFPASQALEKHPASDYHARRVALGNALHGGVAILFAAEEPVLDFDPYRQNSDFYYLTGWNEPGAALLIVGPVNETERTGQTAHSRGYKEILFLPTRNMRMEVYTGAKMDAATPGVSKATGVDNVEPMTNLAVDINKLIADDRRLALNVWTQPEVKAAKSLLGYTATTLGTSAPAPRDVTTLTMPLREVKDSGEIELLKNASTASIAGQREMMKSVKPGVTERTIAGKMTAAWYEQGCERPSYAPIVGTGNQLNDPALLLKTPPPSKMVMSSSSMRHASTRCMRRISRAPFQPTATSPHGSAKSTTSCSERRRPRSKRSSPGKSKINDFNHRDPDTLDTVAYNYINTHGKDLHGQPLGKYWLHGLGHMVGIDVHDPAQYPAVLKPGMVFTIEPGVYIPEEKLGVRIECDFLVLPDGKLLDLDADLPHTAEEVEAAMQK